MFSPNGPVINRELLSFKANALDKKIMELTKMCDGLRHAVACQASNHFERTKFLRLLNIAAKKRIRQPNKLKEKRLK